MMNPLPSLGQTYSLLIQEERQRQVKNAGQFFNDSASSFNAGEHRSFVPPYQSTQRKNDGRRNSQYFCDHCKKLGHTMEKYYKLHGYPNKQPFKPKGGRYANTTWSEVSSQSEATPIANVTADATPSTTLSLP